MARVKYGTIVTEIKGKLSGSVFQKCGQSLSLRSNPSKLISRSPASMITRNNFRKLASLWHTLDAEQRYTFSANAPGYPTFDKWGNRITLSDYQLFIFINRVLQLTGTEPVSEANPYQNVAATDCYFGTYSISGQSFPIVLNDYMPADHALIAYISDQLPANSYRVPLQRFAVSVNLASDILSWDIYDQVSEGFKNQVIAGKNFYCLIREVDLLTGIWSDNIDDINVIES